MIVDNTPQSSFPNRLLNFIILNLQVTLQKCIRTLLSVAARPIPEPFDPTLDLPQVHAFNILRALFHDTALGADVQCLAADSMELAICGFSSPSWAIRNACTLLFGTLLCRMLGCKRVRDEGSRLNSITAAQFFFRYKCKNA